MMGTDRIPILVGVTGHRAIREQDVPALYAAVKSELEQRKAMCPASEIVMLNSLAEGADLLCADAAEELGIALIVPLPMPVEQYAADFSDAGKERLRHHLSRAEQVFIAPYTEAEPREGVGRDYLFRQAGIYVASHSHILLALWDGGPGTDAACGTSEAVGFALNGEYSPASGAPLRSGRNEAVVHIFTPRADRTGEAAVTVHVLGSREGLEDILRRTDDFNQLAAKADVSSRARLPEAEHRDPFLARMERISLAAGALSSRYARTYRRALALLAVASAFLTFAFLMYDEAQVHWMILVCGIMLLGAWSCQRFAARSDCHRRYIEYRALAECLRVQTYLRYAGSRIQVPELLSWTQQEETAWILDALCALEVAEPPKAARDIRVCWVEDQRDYHRKAGKSSRRSLGASERIVRSALLLSIGLYIAAVGFELLCGKLFSAPILHVADGELYRTILKILLGTISAVTLFIANYYGRLSLPRISEDHRKMERFYDKMAAQLQRQGQTEELLRMLAREELIENGNWCSYQRDNKPDLSL